MQVAGRWGREEALLPCSLWFQVLLPEGLGQCWVTAVPSTRREAGASAAPELWTRITLGDRGLEEGHCGPCRPAPPAEGRRAPHDSLGKKGPGSRAPASILPPSCDDP